MRFDARARARIEAHRFCLHCAVIELSRRWIRKHLRLRLRCAPLSCRRAADDGALRSLAQT